MVLEERKKESKIKATIWVVLMDKKKQKITAGRECDQVSAGELRDACCKKLRITTDGAQAFAIWICSPLLQIQLKPSHYPTALCDLWYELLAQFAAVSDVQAKSDLPIIMLMRNAFYPLSQEKMLVQWDPQARYYLTAEAMFNFLTARYPVEEELAYKLAALQLKMEGRKLANFPSGTLQNISNQILPWDVIKRKKKQPLFIDKRIRENLTSLNLTTPGTLDHMYLSHLWTQTCYRCAFFEGQTEVVGKRHDVPVRVGITPHNIFIWNKITNKTLIEVNSAEVNGKLVPAKEHKQAGNKGTFDAFVISFTVVASIKKKSATAIPIFSKQACMMQCMYERLKDESHLHADKTSTSVAPKPVLQQQHSQEVDAILGSAQDFSNPTLKIGIKEFPVSTKHISKKENLRGVVVGKNGKFKKATVKQTKVAKYDV